MKRKLTAWVQFFKKYMYATNLFEINCLGFVSHWTKCLTLLHEEDAQKLTDLDLFPEAAPLNPKVRLAPKILRMQPQGVNRYTTSPGYATTLTFLEHALHLLALWLFTLHHTLWTQILSSLHIKILHIL